MQESLGLASAKKIIRSHLQRTKEEVVSLDEALFRVPVNSLRAQKPQPGYDQSTRDGYVLSAKSDSLYADGQCFTIEGEIPAGSIGKRKLHNGTACRIMTGALVPAGGIRVIPQEDCRISGRNVLVPNSVLERRNPFIRKRGCEIEKGRAVVQAGDRILPEHLVLLAATGHSVIEVHRRTRVAFFCSGSELVASPAEEAEGLKVSGNRYLLGSLIRLSGGIPEYLGNIADNASELAAIFSGLDLDATDVILTTGGVGPGKYDLLERAFTEAGGEIFYRSLHVRPGKSTLFGLLGRALYFGLPGPPPAVSALFNELVGPALHFMQGMKKYRPLEVRASLQVPVFFKETGAPCFKGAVIDMQNGRCLVRLTEENEAPDGYIHFAGRRKNFAAGEMVKVHLTGSYLRAKV